MPSLSAAGHNSQLNSRQPENTPKSLVYSDNWGRNGESFSRDVVGNFHAHQCAWHLLYSPYYLLCTGQLHND